MHYEFYVLWADHTWTVESIDWPEGDRRPTGEGIVEARRQLSERLDVMSDRQLELVGPLYYMTQEEQ